MLLTSHTGRLSPGEADVTVDNTSTKAMADQIMAADKARLMHQLGRLPKADMLAVENALKVHFVAEITKLNVQPKKLDGTAI